MIKILSVIAKQLSEVKMDTDTKKKENEQISTWVGNMDSQITVVCYLSYFLIRVGFHQY